MQVNIWDKPKKSPKPQPQTPNPNPKTQNKTPTPKPNPKPQPQTPTQNPTPDLQGGKNNLNPVEEKEKFFLKFAYLIKIGDNGIFAFFVTILSPYRVPNMSAFLFTEENTE